MCRRATEINMARSTLSLPWATYFSGKRKPAVIALPHTHTHPGSYALRILSNVSISASALTCYTVAYFNVLWNLIPGLEENVLGIEEIYGSVIVVIAFIPISSRRYLTYSMTDFF